MKRKLLPGIIFFAIFMSAAVGGISIAAAQDVPAMTETVTEVVTSTPAPTVEPTPAPVPVPAPSGLSTNDLLLVGAVLLSLVLSLAFSHSTIRAQAIQIGASIPAFLYQGGKATIETGLDQLTAKAKKTPDAYDDEEVARLRALVMAVIKEIDDARGSVG